MSSLHALCIVHSICICFAPYDDVSFFYHAVQEMNPSDAFKATQAHWSLNTANGQASTSASAGAGAAETTAENSNSVSLLVGNDMSRMATAMERIAEAMPTLVADLQSIQLGNAVPSASEATTDATIHAAGTEATGLSAAKPASEGDKIVGDPDSDGECNLILPLAYC
ncbi:uncharacterized protein LOC127751109 [Frankliniella occidentalis]|uniref:Uncharacterized protein LOC127751109 n=1 Tax=Frankliniella occidentalis TaxID=133901 RepID=A0A9C6X6S3_FRAOC|nr:uncharacterized protein LOC127751109 [Frankliniella occidentalis]